MNLKELSRRIRDDLRSEQANLRKYTRYKPQLMTQGRIQGFERCLRIIEKARAEKVKAGRQINGEVA